MIENPQEVRRVLEGSSISLCLDTGHLLIGGTDPAELTRKAPERIAHTHLKDVDDSIAAKVRSGRLTYTEAVRGGMYRPLGTGDVNVESILKTLRENDYDGWYVLEQDTILTEEPAGASERGEGTHSAFDSGAEIEFGVNSEPVQEQPVGESHERSGRRHGIGDADTRDLLEDVAVFVDQMGVLVDPANSRRHGPGLHHRLVDGCEVDGRVVEGPVLE